MTRLIAVFSIVLCTSNLYPQSNQNWQELFNGKNLDGWEVKCTDGDKDKKFWSVDKGTILCNSLNSRDHNYVWLLSNKEYDNFELKLQFQTSRNHKGNSGVQVRSRYDEYATVETGISGWLDGPQVDIESTIPWRNGLIYDETRTTKRWINPSLPDWNISESDLSTAAAKYYYEDEGSGWNDMTIICNGMQIKTIVNDVVVSDYDGTGVLDDAGHKKYLVGSKGHIALQLHKNSENYIRFRNILIREF